MSDNFCIFCEIANGRIPSATVYEDDNFRAILDIAPAHKGHVLLLPKQHFENLLCADEDILAKALPIAKRIAVALKAVTNCDGVNVLQNNGTAAGQSVFHLHIHIIPRFEGDGILPVWEQGSYADGEAAEWASRIAAALD
ncbi:MAG: HIT family protein [Lachnospiraceae bacterium]|nr:HIT family protein [Lachnospiraceae bacterium]